MAIEAMKRWLAALESCRPGDYSTGHVIHPSYDENAVESSITELSEAIEQAEQPAQQEPVQTEPNFDQRKQILDNLERCHHRDSKHEFLRVWIRDWTTHKLSKAAIKQCLTPKQAEQAQPVAWMHTNAIGHVYFRRNPQDKTLNPRPLYTTPLRQPEQPARPQQEPFGHVTVRRLSQRFENHADQYWFHPAGESPYRDNVDEIYAVYTAPPPRQPLTDEEIDAAMPSGIYDCLADPWDCNVGDGDVMRSIKKDVLRIARAIEAAHGITKGEA
jgi:hypothetical protein